jgi:hypothetical protein
MTSAIPALAAVFAFVPQVSILLLVYLNSALAGFADFTVDIPYFPLWAAIAVFAYIFLCSDFVFMRPRFKALAGVVLAAIMAVCIAVPGAVRARSPLAVTVLDVGTGDIVHI